jgi:hypothetical protein
MRELIRLSTRLVVMSERGVEFLTDIYHAPAAKIDLIPHGIPNMPFADPEIFKDEFGVAGKQVLLTFGLLSPNKGVEFALRALPEIIGEFPNIVYIVLGQTHPHLLREEGEAYRLSLEMLSKDLGVQKHVVFFNRFVELEELMRFIGAADIYLTPYLTEAQITSGTLACAFGSGNAVVSTPYWHAAELLADGRGRLVPFRDAAAISVSIKELLRDEPSRHAMRKNAYTLGREMIWSRVAQRYAESFDRARHDHSFAGPKSSLIKTLDELGGLERHRSLGGHRLEQRQVVGGERAVAPVERLDDADDVAPDRADRLGVQRLGVDEHAVQVEDEGARRAGHAPGISRERGGAGVRSRCRVRTAHRRADPRRGA